MALLLLMIILIYKYIHMIAITITINNNNSNKVGAAWVRAMTRLGVRPMWRTSVFRTLIADRWGQH